MVIRSVCSKNGFNVTIGSKRQKFRADGDPKSSVISLREKISANRLHILFLNSRMSIQSKIKPISTYFSTRKKGKIIFYNYFSVMKKVIFSFSNNFVWSFVVCVPKMGSM